MKSMQVALDDELHREAKALASRQGLTLGELVRRAVAQAVGQSATQATEGIREESARWARRFVGSPS